MKCFGPMFTDPEGFYVKTVSTGYLNSELYYV